MLLTGCGAVEAPADFIGNTPQTVLLDTYKLIVNGDYDEARKNFSDKFLEKFVTTKKIAFEDYCSNTKGWKLEWLKT